MIAIALPYPFDAEFMQRALVAGVAVGIFAPMLGTFVVQRRMSLIGDGVGHLAFAGVGAGIAAGTRPVWVALAVAVLGALALEWLRVRGRASGDLALAAIFYAGIAAGVVLLSAGGGLDADVLTYLFGQPLTVSDGEVLTVVALGAGVVATVLVLRRLLFAVALDEDWSRAAGLPAAVANGALPVLVAVSVVAAMRIVGVLLIAALMVMPVASGRLLARSFAATMRWSVVVGVVSVVAGLLVAWFADLAPSGTIVLVATACFVLVTVTRRASARAARA